MKAASIVCGILLLSGIAQLPIGYYAFLRVAITLCAIAIIIAEIKQTNTSWRIIFTVIAVIFNPVIPIYLYRKSICIPIDAITAAVFIIHGLQYKKHKNV